jgi:hypothetical protein
MAIGRVLLMAFAGVGPAEDLAPSSSSVGQPHNPQVRSPLAYASNVPHLCTSERCGDPSGLDSKEACLVQPTSLCKVYLFLPTKLCTLGVHIPENSHFDFEFLRYSRCCYFASLCILPVYTLSTRHTSAGMCNSMRIMT